MSLFLHCQKPEKLRRNLIANLKLYIKFCFELKKQLPKIKILPKDKKIVSLITLLFLFQSAMDNHYYHFDYPLDLEEYPKSPLGFHYLRIKRIILKLAGRGGSDDQQAWADKRLLMLLSKKGTEVIRDLRPHLNKKTLDEMLKSYHAIQTFIKLQQEEERLFYGKNKKGPIFTTGLAIWAAIKKTVRANHGYFKDKTKLLSILNGDPIYGTRKILTGMENFLARSIVVVIRKELQAWG